MARKAAEAVVTVAKGTSAPSAAFINADSLSATASPEAGEVRNSVFFGEKVAQYRKAMSLTQLQLANISGVSQSHISQLEKGTLEPRLTTIMALATALQVDPALLMPKLDPEMRRREETAEERAIRERAERVRAMRSRRQAAAS